MLRFCCLTCWLWCVVFFCSYQLFAQNDRHKDAENEDQIFDHHVHVMSPQLVGHWKSMGVPFSKEDSAYGDPLDILDSQELSGALLVSMAHVYTNGNLRDAIEGDEQDWVQNENDFVASAVAKSPDKLLGFFSVNPLRQYAMEEMERCRANEHLVGLKLHLPACEVDITTPAHLEKIQAVFDWAVEYEVPLLVHFFTADQPNHEEATRLVWRELIQGRDSIKIIFAHLGAAGGYNEVSEAILLGYKEMIDESAVMRVADIYFDMSGAILAEETDGIPATSSESCRRLTAMMREVGIERFLFASDYPVFDAKSNLATLREKLQLEASEFDELINNRLDLFDVAVAKASIQLPEVRKELLRRSAIDQSVRRKMMEGTADFAEVAEVDKANREWLRLQVKSHGWLGRTLVGVDGAKAAWLIVQHADRDLDFQRKCLDMMTAMPEGEVELSSLAYLTDRVLLAEGKPQRFGTQFAMVNGAIDMQRCEDPENVNERRAKMGLDTIEAYRELIEDAYNQDR